MARILLTVIAFYRKVVSPFTPPACRFTPTCSAYAEEAIRRYGAARGSWLAVRRLARCHPFGGSGFDPVPGPRDAQGHEDNDLSVNG
jgi:uncharacterized protein